MLFIIFFTTAFAQVCLGKGEDDCPDSVLDVCKHPIRYFEFPKCESKLESLCVDIKTFAECAANYKERCPALDGPSLEFSQSLLKTSNSFCMNDSAWYKGVIKYGSCYDNFIPNPNVGGACSPDIENKFNLVFSNMSNKPGLFRCFNDIKIATCVIEKLTNICGKMSKELGLHFLNGVGFWNAFCLNHKEEALKMMEDIEITFNPETSEDEFISLFEDISSSYGLNKDMCLSNYKNLCKNPGNFVYDFPENSASLTARCNEHIKYKECLVDYQRTCGEKIWGMDSVNEDLDTLNIFCNESSVLFHALADKGKCFNKFGQHYEGETEERIYKCVDEIQNKDPDKHRDIIYNARYLEEYGIHFCFEDLEFTKCLSEEISNYCGDTAKELMLQALKHNRMNVVCKGLLEEAEFFMKELNFSLNPEYSLEDFISLLENEPGLS